MAKYKHEKTNMPSSSGGLMRYFEEYNSKIMLTPEHVIFICVLVILLELFLHFYGTAILG